MGLIKQNIRFSGISILVIKTFLKIRNGENIYYILSIIRILAYSTDSIQ